MSQLYLPAEHTEADLVLAGQIAERVESAELYVAWTPEHGHAAPEIPALLREPAQQWTDTLALVFQAVREMWTAILGRQALAPSAADAGRPRGSSAPAPKPAPGEAAA